MSGAVAKAVRGDQTSGWGRTFGGGTIGWGAVGPQVSASLRRGRVCPDPPVPCPSGRQQGASDASDWRLELPASSPYLYNTQVPCLVPLVAPPAPHRRGMGRCPPPRPCPCPSGVAGSSCRGAASVRGVHALRCAAGVWGGGGGAVMGCRVRSRALLNKSASPWGGGG